MGHCPRHSLTRWFHVQHYWLVRVPEQNLNLVHLVIMRYIVIRLHNALTLMHQLWPTEKRKALMTIYGLKYRSGMTSSVIIQRLWTHIRPSWMCAVLLSKLTLNCWGWWLICYGGMIWEGVYSFVFDFYWQKIKVVKLQSHVIGLTYYAV